MDKVYLCFGTFLSCYSLNNKVEMIVIRIGYTMPYLGKT